jgi:hypothetical protein
MIYRLATPHDAAEIFAVLEEVGPKIPLLPIRDKQQLLEKVREWCARESNLSIVATGKDGHVVGFQIARQTEAGEKLGGVRLLKGIMLEYAGVTKDSRGQRIFPALIENMKRRGLPLFATVKHSNHCAMADRLVKMGFEKFAIDSDYKQDHFRWRPPKRPKAATARYQ